MASHTISAPKVVCLRKTSCKGSRSPITLAAAHKPAEARQASFSLSSSSFVRGNEVLASGPMHKQASREVMRVNAMGGSMATEDRSDMYEAQVAAKDAPEWQQATFVRSEQVTPSARIVTLAAETSREKVPLARAYTHVGQQAQLKVAGGKVQAVTIAQAPIDPDDDKTAWKILLKLRGDIRAGDTKNLDEDISSVRELDLYVTEDQLDVYNLTEDTAVEIGPFAGNGLNLKALHGIFRYPTVLIFAAGARSLATARALVTSTGYKGLALGDREEARVYTWASSNEELLFSEEFPAWESECAVKVRSAVGNAGSVTSLFDDDDVEYDPDMTACVVLCDDKKTEDQVKSFLMTDGEVAEDAIVLGSQEGTEVAFLRSSPKWQKLED